MGTVTIHYTYFLEDDICDGDFPRDDTRSETFDCEDLLEAVGVLVREGLTFSASGSDWAADPDGSRVINYSTAERVETSGHLSGWSEDEVETIMASVG